VKRAGRVRDVGVLILMGVYALPYVWQALTSLKPEAELLRLPPLLPTRLTLEHYRVVFEQSLLPRALGNSLAIALGTTALVVVLGLLAAYAIARLPIPAKSWLLLGIVAATAFPQIATVSPLYLVMRAFALRDTWTALVLAHTALGLPLVIWLLAGFIREIPVELEQAASLDGAHRGQIFRWIVLPLVAPGAASVALLTFLLSWNEFLYAYTFTATEASRTVPVALALFPGVFEVPWGDIAAASILTSLPPVLIVIALQPYLVRGLLAGSLKD
jgi:trehalose/maltose transport system permease protein